MKLLISVVLVFCLLISGCAISPQFYYANRATLTDHEVCSALLNARTARVDPGFYSDLQNDASNRGYTATDCERYVSENNKKAGVALLLIAGVAVAAKVARSGGGGGGGANNFAPGATDYAWEWDEFYNQYSQLVWACRGVQSGQFADLSQCQGKVRNDWKWPSKSATTR